MHDEYDGVDEAAGADMVRLIMTMLMRAMVCASDPQNKHRLKSWALGPESWSWALRCGARVLSPGSRSLGPGSLGPSILPEMVQSHMLKLAGRRFVMKRTSIEIWNFESGWNGARATAPSNLS